MNNKNKILVACLALLLALSVGYALFSEAITINGTATAKGSFDIEVSCLTTVPDEMKNYHYYKENTFLKIIIIILLFVIYLLVSKI